MKLYISDAIYSANFHLVVYTLFILSKGFNLQQFFILESAYAFASLLSQIPTGTFADKFGRKNSLILSSIINIPMTLIIILSKNFDFIFVASLIGGLGGSFYDGANQAILYDTVTSLKKKDEFKKILGRDNLFSSISAAIAALAGGWLAHFSLVYAWWAYLIVQIPAFINDLTLVEPPIHEEEKLSWRGHLKESIWQAFRGDAAYFVMYSSITAVFFGLAYWLWQPYLQSIKVPIIYFGVVYAAVQLFGGVVGAFAYRVEKKIGMLSSLMAPLIILVTVFIFQSMNFIIIGAIFLVVQSIASSFKGPVVSDYLNSRVPQAQRATILSVDYMIESGIFVVFSPLLGTLVDVYSLKVAYILMAGLLLIVILIFWLAYKKSNPEKLAVVG